MGFEGACWALVLKQRPRINNGHLAYLTWPSHLPKEHIRANKVVLGKSCDSLKLSTGIWHNMTS